MSLRTDVLAKDLNDYLSRSPRGSQAALSRRSGVSPSTIKRIANGELTPTIETWEKLHRAAPDIVPPVIFNKETGPIGTPNAVRKEGQKSSGGEETMEDLINKVRMVLTQEEDNLYRKALTENIRAFFHAVANARPQPKATGDDP